MQKYDFDQFLVVKYLLNVYTMFQIDISKDVEKSPENFGKS